MENQIRWAAGQELTALLRRYYAGEAEHWPAIQALVHAELRAYDQTIGPRHVRFRRTECGYLVIVDAADDCANL